MKQQPTLRYLDDVIDRYSGSVDDLESALGMAMLGPVFGWRLLLLMHSKPTVAKYERILGIKVREAFPPIGSAYWRADAGRIEAEARHYWRVVSGEEKPKPGRDRKRIISAEEWGAITSPSSGRSS